MFFDPVLMTAVVFSYGTCCCFYVHIFNKCPCKSNEIYLTLEITFIHGSKKAISWLSCNTITVALVLIPGIQAIYCSMWLRMKSHSYTFTSL